jgi:tetratricopeptide (TPR) repeat protein
MAAAFIALIVFVFYLPILRAGFIWDDDAMLTANPWVRLPTGLYYIWFTTAPTDYWPLTYSSLWLEWRFWGMNATGYHITNVLLHAASCILFWRVLQRLAVPGAWLAAVLFAVHPVNVESVAWITERKNTLSMFFAMLSVWWYLKSEAKEPEASARASRFYWLSLLAFILSLLAKTSTVMLPCVLILLDWWRSRSPSNRAPALARALNSPEQGKIQSKSKSMSTIKNLALRLAPFFLVSLVLGLVTIWFQMNRAIGSDVIRTDSLAGRIAGAGSAVWFYLFKALLPLKLSFVYPRWEISVGSPLSWLPLLAMLVGLAICWKFRERWGRACLVGFGVFLLMLLPVLGFVNVYFHRYSLVADHWQYFALTGIVALVVGVPAAFVRRFEGTSIRKEMGALHLFGCTAGAIIIVLFGGLTSRQTLIYANSETVWRDTLKKNPKSWLALNNLGILAVQRGDYAEARSLHLQSLDLKPNQIEAHNNLGEIYLAEGKIADAREHYLAALQLNPEFPMTHYNLGNLLDHEGRRDEAMACYLRALELDPRFPQAHNNIGCLLAEQGKFDDAVPHFQKALRERPDYVEAMNNFAGILNGRGRAAEAVPLLQQAIRFKPNYSDAHHNLGDAWQALKKPRDAFEEYRIALAWNPNHGPAHFKIANLFLANNNLDAAAEHYRAASALNPNGAEPHYQLATISAERKQLAEAVEHYQAAIRLKPDWVEALNNLAWIYATCADAKYRNGTQAVELAARAVQLTRTNDSGVLDTLAAAYAENGQGALAVATAEKAVTIGRQNNKPQFQKQLEDRLRIYQAGQQYRE